MSGDSLSRKTFAYVDTPDGQVTAVLTEGRLDGCYIGGRWHPRPDLVGGDRDGGILARAFVRYAAEQGCSFASSPVDDDVPEHFWRLVGYVG